MPPRDDWREWWTLGGVVTEEGARTFVRKFQVDRVRLVTLGLLLESPQIQDIPWWGRFVVPELGNIHCPRRNRRVRVFIFMSSFVGFIRLEQGRLDLRVVLFARN